MPQRQVEKKHFQELSLIETGDIVMESNLKKGFDLMTEPELIEYLLIPEISKAEKFENVIENLRRFHNLPSISLCRQPLYPRRLIDLRIEQQGPLQGGG